jgi:HD-GYP domain-containing protein (c-di-GMP phosphodiesterase class II)
MNAREEREMWRTVKSARDRADYLARKEAKAARIVAQEAARAAQAESDRLARIAEDERIAAWHREQRAAQERYREECRVRAEERRAELAANPPAPRPSRPLTRAEALLLLPLLLAGV